MRVNALSIAFTPRHILEYMRPVAFGRWQTGFWLRQVFCLRCPLTAARDANAFPQRAYDGTSSSNLGQGYRNLSTAITDGWIDDGDTSNIDRIGHRRWCLDPRM